MKYRTDLIFGEVFCILIFFPRFLTFFEGFRFLFLMALQWKQRIDRRNEHSSIVKLESSEKDDIAKFSLIPYIFYNL